MGRPFPAGRAGWRSEPRGFSGPGRPCRLATSVCCPGELGVAVNSPDLSPLLAWVPDPPPAPTWGWDPVLMLGGVGGSRGCGVGAGATGVPLALALPRPLPVCSFVCPVWYLPGGLCPQRLEGGGALVHLGQTPHPISPLLLAVSELCPVGSPRPGCAGKGLKGGRKPSVGGQYVFPPHGSGFLELFVWGRPRVEFYIPRVLGVCRIYVHIGLVVFGVAAWRLGGRDVGQGLSLVVLVMGWGWPKRGWCPPAGVSVGSHPLPAVSQQGSKTRGSLVRFFGGLGEHGWRGEERVAGSGLAQWFGGCWG